MSLLYIVDLFTYALAYFLTQQARINRTKPSQGLHSNTPMHEGTNTCKQLFTQAQTRISQSTSTSTDVINPRDPNRAKTENVKTKKKKVIRDSAQTLPTKR